MQNFINLSPLAYLRTGISVIPIFVDRFDTDRSAGSVIGTPAEPGPGNRDGVDTNNRASITGGVLRIASNAADTPYENPRYYWDDTPITRTPGAVMGFAHQASINGVLIGLRKLLTGSSGNVQYGVNYPGVSLFAAWNGDTGSLSTLRAITSGTKYECRIVLRSVGAELYVKGGTQFPDWTLVWIWPNGSDATLYVSIQGDNTAGNRDHDYVAAAYLGGHWTQDKGRASIDLVGIAQSNGSNLVNNGDFASGLTGWTTVGTPTTIEVVGGRLHVITDATSEGALSDQIITQDGEWYELLFDAEVVSGQLGGIFSNSFGIGYLDPLTGNRSYQALGQVSAEARTAFFTSSAASSEFYVDNVIVRKVTPMVEQIATADAIHILKFTLPASPIAGQRITLNYRIQSNGNSWMAYLQRNLTNTAWDLRVDSISSYLATNRLNVTGVGTPDTILVSCRGSDHDFYTFAANTPTKRGGTVSVSHLNTETKISAVFSTGFTGVELYSQPATSPLYAVLDRVA